MTQNLQHAIARIAGLGDAHSVVPIQGSGTFAVEAMLTSLLDAHSHVLIIENGVYSARMTEICRIHRISHEVLRLDPYQALDLVLVEQRLQQSGHITHLAAVHFETALGVLNDLEGLSRLAVQHGALLLLDVISTFGAMALNIEPRRIAGMALSANKCLHGLPGVAFVIARTDLLLQNNAPRSLSLDLKAQWLGLQQDGQWRFTPPLQVLLALQQAIQEYEQHGGQAARLKTYALRAEHLLAGMRQIGFAPVIAAQYRAPIIMTFQAAPGVMLPMDQLHAWLAQQGLHIYPTRHANPHSFRVGVIGELSMLDIDELVAALARFVALAATEGREPDPRCETVCPH